MLDPEALGDLDNLKFVGNRLLLLTKNALMKSGQKIWAGPPPSYSKEQLLFFGKLSLTRAGTLTKYKKILANILRPAVMERGRIIYEGF